MSKELGIARNQGIHIYVDWKGVIVLLLVVWALTGAILALLHPEWDWMFTWATALIAPLVFLASVTAYEMVNAWVVNRNSSNPKAEPGKMLAPGSMDMNVTSVPPNIPVSSLVNDYIIGSNEFACPVMDHGRLVGLIRFTDIRKVPVDKWDLTEVGEIMTSVNQLMEAKNMT